MRRLVGHVVVLTLFYAALSGSMAWSTLALGAVLSTVALRLMPPARRSTLRLSWKTVLLAGTFTAQLVRSTWQVVHDILTPGLRARPGVVAVPLSLDDDAAITVLANLISLTPGTLSLDVTDDRRVLYVHTMYLGPDGADGTRRQIQDTLERRVREAVHR